MCLEPYFRSDLNKDPQSNQVKLYKINDVLFMTYIRLKGELYVRQLVEQSCLRCTHRRLNERVSHSQSVVCCLRALIYDQRGLSWQQIIVTMIARIDYVVVAGDELPENLKKRAFGSTMILWASAVPQHDSKV